MLGERTEVVEKSVLGLVGAVGMDANDGVDLRILLCECDSAAAAFDGSADGDDAIHTRGNGAAQDGVEVVGSIGAIDNVRFKRPVVPGDQMVLDIELLWVRGGIGKIKSSATVDGELAASMEMVFKLVEKEE